MLTKRNERFPDFPRLFDGFFDREIFDWSNTNFSPINTTLPSVNIKDEKNNFIVEVAVPGMKKEDFQIDLKDNLLTISSEKKANNEVVEDNYTRKEYSYQSFKRSFSLPADIVDNEKISAKYENGELLVTLPKKEEVKFKEPQQIVVN